MAASTSNRFDIGMGFVEFIELPVAASTHIYSGILLCTSNVADATRGMVYAASNTASHVFCGVSKNEANNASGAAGAIKVQVVPPQTLRYVEVDATSPLDSWVGRTAYIVDDHTVNVTDPGNTVVCGKIASIRKTDVSGRVLVDLLG